jgi:membrane protease YdiL (CAAX protease family)
VSIPPPTRTYPHPGPPPVRPELPEGAQPAPAPSPVPPWRPWTAPVALIAGFGIAIFGYALIAGIASAFGARYDAGGVMIVATVFQDAALIASAVLFARMATRPAPWQFGLRATRFWRALGWAVLGYVGYVVIAATYAAAFSIDSQENLPDDLGVDDSTLALVAVAILVTVVAPIAEEFFFRGYYFTALRNWKGPWLAAILSGATFGAIHFGSAPPEYVPPLAVLGVALALIYWRTGSLYPCIALHCLNNCLAFGTTQSWDWQIPVSMAGALALIALLLQPFRGSAPLRPAAP